MWNYDDQKNCENFTNWIIISYFKGCVRYIFASLFYMSKREHLWNKEKYVLFHFESSARSWDNQLLTFWIFKYHDVIKCPSMKHILLSNLGSKRSLVMKFGQFVQYYKIIFFIKKFYEKWGLKTSSSPFLIFKESSVKKILWRSACRFQQILLLHI